MTGRLGPTAPRGILDRVQYVSAIALGLCLLGTPAAPTSADQRDPRLAILFDQLKLAPDVHVAEVVAASIWTIWSEADDRAVNILMRDGVSAMGRRDLRSALSKFDQIVTIAPEFAEGWNKRATVNYLMGRYPESLADIDKTLALEPRHFGALSGRGLVYIELGEEELALESFEAALDIYPLLPGASMNASALRKRLGSKDI